MPTEVANPFSNEPPAGFSLQQAHQAILEGLETKLLPKLLRTLEDDLDDHNHGRSKLSMSFYTGTSGVIYTLLQVQNMTKSHSSQVTSMIEKLRTLERQKKVSTSPSLYCGSTGPAIYRKDMSPAKVIEKYGPLVEDEEDDEALYGRSGYIASLFMIMHEANCDKETRVSLLDEAARTLDLMMKRGQLLSQTLSAQGASVPPLMYYWHNSLYLGAAHGLVSILLSALLVEEYLESRPKAEKLVLESIEFLVTLITSEGKFPSKLGSRSPSYRTQWCHGSPGMVLLLSCASQKWPKFLSALELVSDECFRSGVLTKGEGLCHGWSGNALCLFSPLFASAGPSKLSSHAAPIAGPWWNSSTVDVTLERSKKAVWRCYSLLTLCFDQDCLPKEHRKRIISDPDRPSSLFEGAAGPVSAAAAFLEILKDLV